MDTIDNNIINDLAAVESHADCVGGSETGSACDSLPTAGAPGVARAIQGEVSTVLTDVQIAADAADCRVA